jgi:hypothetical protein
MYGHQALLYCLSPHKFTVVLYHFVRSAVADSGRLPSPRMPKPAPRELDHLHPRRRPSQRRRSRPLCRASGHDAVQRRQGRRRGEQSRSAQPSRAAYQIGAVAQPRRDTARATTRRSLRQPRCAAEQAGAASPRYGSGSSPSRAQPASRGTAWPTRRRATRRLRRGVATGSATARA